MSSKRQDLEYQLAQLNRNNQQTIEKVDLLNELAEEIFTSGSPSSADHYEEMLELSTEAEQLARHLSYQKGIAYSLFMHGQWSLVFIQPENSTGGVIRGKIDI